MLLEKRFFKKNWVWDSVNKSLAQIVCYQSLWKHKILKLLDPLTNETYTAQESDITPLTNQNFFCKERIYFASIHAKLLNTLSKEILLSPMESNVIPLPHQITILEKVFSNPTIRYLLADEVGLGKTIEAGLILRELKIRGLIERILIVVPMGLTMQWVQEMREHFNETFKIIGSNELNDYSKIFNDDNLWEHFNQVIVSMDSVKPLKTRRGWTSDKIKIYNETRFNTLVNSNWDLIIFDEAHRVGGSSTGVARHRLAKKLAEVTPNLLLLSATPHQGKTNAFRRLLALIDPPMFPSNVRLTADQVKPYVMRTEKKMAVNHKGKRLFKDRKTAIIPVSWTEKHGEQENLYYAVTEYVTNGYNQAIQEKKTYLGFLMTLMQRLVSSSTRAIRMALERRLERLNTSGVIVDSSTEDLLELDSDDQFNYLLNNDHYSLLNEKDTIKMLINLALKNETTQPDARVEVLLELIYDQQSEEQEIKTKFLIFTEFLPTQLMLKEFLEDRGFSSVMINGSMTIDERMDAQRKFSENIPILISTEAGGEGINLQFCHIVINYDLPWNPMKLEQRIGRIDRIGQTKNVKAFNFIFDNTIEYRVYEILQEKLQIILEEFGVDKTSDVLDTVESNINFDKVYMDSITQPEKLNQNVDILVNRVRKEFHKFHKERRLLPELDEFDNEKVEQIQNHPLPYWLENLIKNYVKMSGGSVSASLFGLNIRFPDKTLLENVTFHKGSAEKYKTNYISFEHPFIKSVIENSLIWPSDLPIPQIIVEDLSIRFSGYFSLWKISFTQSKHNLVRIFPIFVTEEGNVYNTTANHIWDRLIDSNTQIKVLNECDKMNPNDIYQDLFQKAIKVGERYYYDLKKTYEISLEKEKRKNEYAFQIRCEALSNIGLKNVREKRLRELKWEEIRWKRNFEKKIIILPELDPLLIIKIVGEE